jgi:hypothetical protein
MTTKCELPHRLVHDSLTPPPAFSQTSAVSRSLLGSLLSSNSSIFGMSIAMSQTSTPVLIHDSWSTGSFVCIQHWEPVNRSQ